VEFSVWAPNPSRVDLVSGGETVAMRRDDRSWWHVTLPGAGGGTRYAFSLDGGPPRPDPRSASQPQGVHGPSEVVSPESFRWTDHQWRGLPLPGAVLYELHVGTFSPEGTFDGAARLLPHLVELGIDAIELLPVAEFPGTRGWGYDGVDLFAPHHSYGGPDGLRRLVDACHGHGIGVVLDVVYNHCGPSGNYLGEFGPYFSDTVETNWGAAVNFDGPGSDEVRRFVIDNARMWLRDYHVDGLRLDAVHAIIDRSALHILEELAVEVDVLAAQLGRELLLIGESDLNDPRFVRSRDAGGYGLDSAWADEWHHALHAALTGERSGYYEDFGSLEQLGKALRQAWVYDGLWSAHRHRHFGRSPSGLRGDQFVVCTQNHDQVGNRALGERAPLLMSEGRVKVAAALLLTSPFTPLLFQGEEWGTRTPFQFFTDLEDPSLRSAVREGRRREFARFGWDPHAVPDPEDVATFERSTLDWDERRQAPHDAVLGWYRELLALRRRVADLGDPRLEKIRVDADEAEGTLAVRRGAVLVLVNLARCDRKFHLGDVEVLAASCPPLRQEGACVVVPPDAVVIAGPPSRRP